MSSEDKKVEEKPIEEKPVEEKPVEEKPAEEEEDDDEPPSLESVEDAAHPEGADAAAAPKQTRAEKKVRKAMQKLGLQTVPGIIRCTIRRDKNFLYYINDPEVFRTASGDSYVCFGKIQFEDMSATQNALANSMKSEAAADAAAAAAAAAEPAEAAAAAPAEEKKEEKEEKKEGEESVDESGLNSSDIDLVVAQAKCTRAKAVEALRKNSGDIVSSVMELSQ